MFLCLERGGGGGMVGFGNGGLIRYVNTSMVLCERYSEAEFIFFLSVEEWFS